METIKVREQEAIIGLQLMEQGRKEDIYKHGLRW